MIDVSMIIVSYYSGHDLPRLLSSVDAAVGSASWHVTIVNNALDDDLHGVLPVEERVSIVDATENLGYSGGLNLGLEYAPAARCVVFLNPDLTLLPGSIASLREAIDGGADAAVPLTLDDDGLPQPSLRREPSILAAFGEAVFGNAWPLRPQSLAEMVRDPAAYQSAHDIDWATGAALAVSTDVVRRVGPWDEARFFLYSEETDYARRIRQQRGRIQFVPGAAVQHRGAGSGSSPQLDALLEVNKLRYFRKWHGPVASGVFGLVLLTRNAVRPHRPGAREAVRSLLSRSARAALPGGPR